MTKITKNHIELINESETFSFDSNLEYCFISKCIDSNVVLNVEHEINLIFLQNEGNTNSKIEINLTTDKAKAEIREIALTTGKEQFIKNVEITHLSKNSISNYKFFGFAINDSNLKISAKSSIKKGMSGSEAHQILRVLTDDKAKAEGQPGLFIDDFDVKASHGNSIGQISGREMYYLQSKGIPAKAARWMIIEARMVEAFKALSEDESKNIIADLKSRLGVTV